MLNSIFTTHTAQTPPATDLPIYLPTNAVADFHFRYDFGVCDCLLTCRNQHV